MDSIEIYFMIGLSLSVLNIMTLDDSYDDEADFNNVVLGGTAVITTMWPLYIALICLRFTAFLLSGFVRWLDRREKANRIARAKASEY